MKFNIKSRKGFTLIELLVVIGILAVLAAIAIPSVAGLIDRANVSADKTNSNEMTNAIERFASEYELYCQDIASGVIVDENNDGKPDGDLDSAQGRVYNVTGITTRSGIEALEIAQDDTATNDVAQIYRDTKYPTNAYTLKKIVENYTKTSSSTFEPKQSDMHYWYSPDCGVVVFAEPNADQNKEEKLNSQIISGMDAKGNKLDENTKWIDLTITTLNDENQNDVTIAFTPKEWSGFKNIKGSCIWTDGTNFYHSSFQEHYVLNGDTWTSKTWNGLSYISAPDVWTDGINTYYSSGSSHYVLNGDTWDRITWNGLTRFDGSNIWKDGTNIYYSGFNNSSSKYENYVLNGNTWSKKTWYGNTELQGKNIWTDGTNIYYSVSAESSGRAENYVLNGETWEVKTWEGFSDPDAYYIWSYKGNYYYSKNSNQYILSGGSWEAKSWGAISNLGGHNVWSDGVHYYYSNGAEQYQLS